MSSTKRPSDGSDGQTEDLNSSKRQKSTRKYAPPLYKATVIETADATSVRVTGSTADLDESILVRMKKCIARGNHPETPEAEAKAALHLASKMMKTYNVSIAEVLAHETPEVQRSYAGQSCVAIQRFDGDRSKKVQQSNYVGTLCVAIETFFGCQSYTYSGTDLELTFYGIAENTVAAAQAFEMVYNLIVQWARPYKGRSGKNSYCYGIADELCKTAKKEQQDEEKRAKQAEEDARAARVRQEQADDCARLDRLHDLHPPNEKMDEEGKASKEHPATPEPATSREVGGGDALQNIRDRYLSSDEESLTEYDEYDEWNGFSDDEDQTCHASDIDIICADFNEDDTRWPRWTTHGDVNDEIDRLAGNIKRSLNPELEPNVSLPYRSGNDITDPAYERRDSTQSKSETPGDPQWKSHTQLIKFRETTDQIAQDWLKGQGTKLYSGRQRSGVNDWDAFRKGQKDSKKIDVRRKTIAE